MSLKSRRERYKSSRLRKARRYLWYAIGEILLIFAGITLALGFSNWNEERHLRRLETMALADIAANLRSNADAFNRHIRVDLIQIASCERVLEALSQKTSWQDELATDLYECRWWTSPYLNYAAYDSLKSRGTELISDPKLRYAILDLYEADYAWLENDIDKTLWNFQTAVIEPVFNRHVLAVESERFVPNDYKTLLESDEFTNMLHMKLDYQRTSVRGQRNVLQETEKVIRLIDAQLSRGAH